MDHFPQGRPVAGVGQNYLYGGSGDDVLVSGADGGETSDDNYYGEGEGYYGEGEGYGGGNAQDILVGGDGDDTFVFHAGDGSDTVTDFGEGDKLVFEGFTVDDIQAALDAFMGDHEGEEGEGEVVIGAGEGEERVEVTLQNQSGSGYSVSEDANGNAVVTVNPADNNNV